MGIDERSRLRAVFLQARHEKEEKEIQLIKAKEEKEKNDSLSSCNFEFTETDFDSALRKFVTKCHTFETRELGPLGWSTFTADSVRFLDFQTILKKQFDLKFNSLELGALIMFCYPIAKIKSVMSCRIFINSFLQNKLATEPYKGRSNEQYLLKKYIDNLKESYLDKNKKLAELSDVSTAPAKPWRMYVMTVHLLFISLFFFCFFLRLSSFFLFRVCDIREISAQNIIIFLIFVINFIFFVLSNIFTTFIFLLFPIS